MRFRDQNTAPVKTNKGFGVGKKLFKNYYFYAVIFTFSCIVILVVTILRYNKLTEYLGIDDVPNTILNITTFFMKRFSAQENYIEVATSIIEFTVVVLFFGFMVSVPLIIWKYLKKKHPNLAIVGSAVLSVVIMIFYLISISGGEEAASNIKNFFGYFLGLYFAINLPKVIGFEIWTRKGGLEGGEK